MGTITLPNTFSPNTTILSAQVNSNFSTIYDEFNGSIADANVSPTAAIASTKMSFSTLTATSGQDIVTRLDDAAGVRKFAIQDSAAVEQAYFNSDGLLRINTSAGFKGRSKTFSVDGSGAGNTDMFTLSSGNTGYDTYAGIFACTVTGSSGKEGARVIGFVGATGVATQSLIAVQVLSTVTILLTAVGSGNNVLLRVAVTNLDGVGGLAQADAFVAATGRSGITIVDA